MMLSEFVERTGFEPLPFEYAKIEEAYYNSNGDKDAFCKAFVDGDGEKKIYQARAAETIERLAREAERLKIIQIAEQCKDLDELIEKLKAKAE